MAHDDPIHEDRPLPTQRDFDNGVLDDLDAQCAWRNFGGLTLEQAHAKFQEAPGCYQEDFMFMGGKAFAYYFPVVESYFREATDAAGGDDREAWNILAHCIRMQFIGENLSAVRQLAPRVLELAEFVRKNIDLCEPDERQEVDAAWQRLQNHIRQVIDKPAH